MSSWNLEGKTALITGGTHGIGLACAKELAALGATVMLVARNGDSEISFVTHLADITKEADRIELVKKIDRLDILVNNVGINISKPSEEFTLAEIGQILDTNFIACFELIRLFLPLLKSSGNASIINIASVAGTVDVGTGSIYAASKAAIIQLTKSLAIEFAADNIRVNSVSPWYTNTRRTANFLKDPANLESVLSKTPLNRIAEPEDIAGVVAFLAMEKSNYITGQDILVDGGLVAGRG